MVGFRMVGFRMVGFRRVGFRMVGFRMWLVLGGLVSGWLVLGCGWFADDCNERLVTRFLNPQKMALDVFEGEDFQEFQAFDAKKIMKWKSCHSSHWIVSNNLPPPPTCWKIDVVFCRGRIVFLEAGFVHHKRVWSPFPPLAFQEFSFFKIFKVGQNHQRGRMLVPLVLVPLVGCLGRIALFHLQNFYGWKKWKQSSFFGIGSAATVGKVGNLQAARIMDVSVETTKKSRPHARRSMRLQCPSIICWKTKSGWFPQRLLFPVSWDLLERFQTRSKWIEVP